MSETELEHHREQNYPTPESLLRDSQSEASREAVSAWLEAKERGKQTMTESCADARVSLRHALGDHPALVSITGISAAQPLLPYRYAATHPGVSNVLAVGHINCGGLAALAATRNSGEKHNGGVYDYIPFIRSPDVVVQTTLSAHELARLSNRPTLAMVMNHETEKLFPVAFFTERGHAYKASFPMDALRDTDVSRIYQGNDMPDFNEAWLPEDMQDLLKRNRRQVEKNMANPQFIASQRVQNPHSVLVSTSVMSASTRYTETFGQPNTAFAVRLPYEKRPIGFNIDPEQLKQVVDQSDYAIAHSMVGHGPFSQTRRLIIETPHMGSSRLVADAFMSRPTVRKWVEEHGAHIITTELQSAKTASQSGKTVAAEIYK